MQVKNDLRNNDLESFKNIVNSTNDTHNKLISSIQKNVDQMIRDKSQQEGVTMAMEEKISKISVLRLGKLTIFGKLYIITISLAFILIVIIKQRSW